MNDGIRQILKGVSFPEAEMMDEVGRFGGRYWDRTSDPHDVNVVLYR
jgi:hypothetical protein